MTTPEDRDLWERDEEALRTPAPVDPMRSEAARWQIHVQGPDDLIPAASRLDAMRQAHEINAVSVSVVADRGDDPLYPLVWAVPSRIVNAAEVACPGCGSADCRWKRLECEFPVPAASEAARVARYAAEMCEPDANWMFCTTHQTASGEWPCPVGPAAVVAVADEERAALVAEVERLRASLVELAPADEVLVEGSFFQRADLPRVLGNFMRTAAEYGREAKTAAVERDQLRETVTRLNRRAQIAQAAIHELTHGTGKGKARAVAAEMWERCQSAHEQGCRRAQEAEAKVAKVKALVGPGVTPDGEPLPEWVHVDELRAALADAPAEQRADGGS